MDISFNKGLDRKSTGVTAIWCGRPENSFPVIDFEMAKAMEEIYTENSDFGGRNRIYIQADYKRY